MENILLGTIIENTLALQGKVMSIEDRRQLEDACDKIQKLRDFYCSKAPIAKYKCRLCGEVREIPENELEITKCSSCEETGYWVPYIY